MEEREPAGPRQTASVMDRVREAIRTMKRLQDADVAASLASAHAAVSTHIRRKDVMAHGGRAVNSVLPPDLRFYGENDAPDFDVLLLDASGGKAKRVMFAAQKELAGLGYAAHFKPALHERTLRLRAHPKDAPKACAMRYGSLLDVTSVDPSDFVRLRELRAAECPPSQRGARGPGMCVPTAYMKQSMHRELCRPTVHVQRWEKVAARIDALYRAHPTCSPRGAKPAPRTDRAPAEPKRLAARASVVEAVRNLPGAAVLVGRLAIDALLGDTGPADGMDAYAVVAAVLVKDLEAAREALGAAASAPIAAANMFLPRRCTAALPGGGLVTLYEWEHPTACFEGFDRVRVGTPDAVLLYLYGELMQTGGAEVERQIDRLVDKLHEVSDRRFLTTTA